MLSLEPVDGIPPYWPGYIIWTSLRADKVSVTLTSFSRSQKDLHKNTCTTISHEPVDGIPPNLPEYFIGPSLKADYVFADLDFTFKGTGGLR